MNALGRSMPLIRYALTLTWSSPVTWLVTTVLGAALAIVSAIERSRALAGHPVSVNSASGQVWMLVVMVGVSGLLVGFHPLSKLGGGLGHLRRAGLSGRAGATAVIIYGVLVAALSPVELALVHGVLRPSHPAPFPVRLLAVLSAPLIPAGALALVYLSTPRISWVKLIAGALVVLLFIAAVNRVPVGGAPLALIPAMAFLSVGIPIAMASAVERWARRT